MPLGVEGSEKFPVTFFMIREIGLSAWTSPAAKPDTIFYYYDPIHLLGEEGRAIWANPSAIDSRLAKVREEATARLDFAE